MRIVVSLASRGYHPLAKRPPSCLEFIVVHESIHLIERQHNDRGRKPVDEGAAILEAMSRPIEPPQCFRTGTVRILTGQQVISPGAEATGSPSNGRRRSASTIRNPMPSLRSFRRTRIGNGVPPRFMLAVYFLSAST
jgi:hypothetical protein